MLIHMVLGPSPLKNAFGPSSLHILPVILIALSLSFASISLVFSTSSGVVKAAATPPLRLPNTALSAAVTSEALPTPFPNRRSSDQAFIFSHSGNCITVNGTSRITVTPHPRYSSAHILAIPWLFLCARIDASAARDEGCCFACARCFTTSVGTLTAHAAISPNEAASMCAPADDVGFPLLAGSSNCFFTPSYVTKNRAAPGADPTTALPIPL